jgi:hypothetical protein
MKWILYMMLFSTPAVTVTNKDDKACLKRQDVTDIVKILDCRQKFEGRNVWSLQGSSQMEFALFESCVRTQDTLIANSNVASTMTLRTWCFCESDNEKCPTGGQLKQQLQKVRDCETQGSSGCQAEVSKSLQGAPGGQNSSSIRLYPPQ